MPYSASDTRYDSMPYARVGRSGLKLPRISLGWWYNFGSLDKFENGRAMARYAFDHGITHFDLANNYGPMPGSAETTLGLLLKQDFGPYRDELIISTKAGYDMWPGPYGEWGSRKYLIASLDQSLKRMGLDYVDIFYSHRPDPDTPLEETMGALDFAVRSGRALYVGVSNYSPEDDPPGGPDPALPWHAAADPPAALQHARPLGGGRPAGCVGRGRRRRHRLFAAGAGTTDRSLLERHPRRRSCHQDRAGLADP